MNRLPPSLALLLLAPIALACSTEPPVRDGAMNAASPAAAAPVPGTSNGMAVQEGQDEPATPLTRQPDLLFGSPLPQGLIAVSQDPDVARFTSHHDLQRLIEFYRRELRGWEARIDSTGAAFETRHPDRADIYLARIDDQTVEVNYLRSGLDEEFRAAFLHQLNGTAPDLPFARQYPWLQGFTAPDDIVEEVRRLQPQPQGGGYYEEHLEQRDGQTVRVLVPRDGSLTSHRQDPGEGTGQPDGPRIGPRRSYTRQDTYRSLLPEPARGIDGEALPFFGTSRLQIPGAEGSR